jgi:general secretion pathway protein M
MNGVLDWWRGLSLREQRLVGAMLGLFALVFLWLGVWRPVSNGLESSRNRYAIAVDNHAAVAAKVALLRARPETRQAGPAGTIEQLVAQSAGDLGLTLDRSAGQGDGRIAVTIGAARAGAALRWIAGLEERGLTVETLSMNPGTTAGTVAVQAVLVRQR